MGFLSPSIPESPPVTPAPKAKPAKDDRLDPDGLEQAEKRAKDDKARKGRNSLRIPLASDTGSTSGIQIG